MTSPLPTLFGRHQTKQLDLDRPDGCDHDQNVYHYRLVDGAMVLRGLVLGHGWETRPMSWQTLSCYKCKEDDSMAVITKESVKPKPRADKAEILTNAKELMDGGQSLSETARILDVPLSTLHSWMAREKKRAANARKVLESVETIKPMGETVLSDKATEVAICADCGKEIEGCIFTGKGHGPRCFSCAVKKDYDQDNTTDFDVKYVPTDNDHYDAPVEEPDKVSVVIHNTGISKKCAYCGELFPSGTPGTWVKDGFVSRWYCEECGPRTSTAPPSQYMHEDNDYLDEPIPYVVGPDPLDAQIDVMLDALWAEKRAKLKAHLKPLLSDAEAWDMVKCIIARGLA